MIARRFMAASTSTHWNAEPVPTKTEDLSPQGHDNPGQESADRNKAGDLMDGIYRHQRQIYDVTRKYYLLGRDRLIRELDVPAGGLVLELGCGTGRNLIKAAHQYPDAKFHGIDLSSEMLKTARAGIERSGLEDRILLACGDATAFDPQTLFGTKAYDRVFISYSLSMIPQWEAVIEAALAAVAGGGSLHVVDFGQQERLPTWFRRMLHAWLAKFHVTPRAELEAELASAASRHGGKLEFASIFADYTRIATIRLG